MPEVFNLPVKVGASGDDSLNVTTVQFGDGYKSKMPNGINGQTSEWSVSMTGDAEKIKGFTDFIKRHNGAKSFYWTPPLEEQGLFTVEKWKTDTHGAGLFTVSATFESAYSAGDIEDRTINIVEGGALIDDAKPSSTTTYSGTKIEDLVKKSVENKANTSVTDQLTKDLTTNTNAIKKAVKTVNNNPPDENGNVTISTSGGGTISDEELTQIKTAAENAATSAKAAEESVGKAASSADSANTAASNSAQAAQNAQEVAKNASDYALSANTAANTAVESAQQAAQSAETANNSLQTAIEEFESLNPVRSINDNPPDENGNIQVAFIDDEEPLEDKAYSGKKVDALFKEEKESRPTITISTEEPDINTPGKEGDLWYQIAE